MATKKYMQDRVDEINSYNDKVSGEWWNSEEYDYLPDSWKERLKANPFANKFLVNPKNTDMAVYESYLSQLNSFNDYNADIINEYFNFLNSLPTTQVAQRRAAGLNPDLNGGSDIDNSVTESPTTTMPDYSLAEAQALRLQQAQFIGQCVVQAIQSAMNVVGQIQGFKVSQGQIEQQQITNEWLPKVYKAQIDSMNSGTRVNTASVPKIEAETANLSEQGKLIQAQTTSAQKQVQYVEYNEGLNAALLGAKAVAGASDDYMRGYNSIIGSDADRLAIVERLSRADQAAGIYRGFVDHQLGYTEYMDWYVEAAQKLQQNQFKLDRLLQQSGMTAAEYDIEYTKSLNAAAAGARFNKEQGYYSAYYGNREGKTQALADNAGNTLALQVDQVKLDNIQTLSTLYTRLSNAARNGDVIAKQALFNMYMPGAYQFPMNNITGTASAVGNLLQSATNGNQWNLLTFPFNLFPSKLD